MDLPNFHNNSFRSNSFKLVTPVYHPVLPAKVRKLFTFQEWGGLKSNSPKHQYNSPIYLLVPQQRVLSFIGLWMGHYDSHDELSEE